MAENTSLPIGKKLPPMEHEFSIQVTGEETQFPYIGSFRYRRPSLGERGQVEVSRARLVGDQVNIPDDIADLLYMLAFLKVTLRSWPDWWQEAGFGSALYDTNVVVAVYDECLKFEKDWKRKVNGDVQPVSASA